MMDDPLEVSMTEGRPAPSGGDVKFPNASDPRYQVLLRSHLPKLDYQSRKKIERVEKKHSSVAGYRGTYLHGGAAPFERKLLADAIRALRRHVVKLNGKRRAVAGWYRIRFHPDTDEAGQKSVNAQFSAYLWSLERKDERP